LTEQEQAPFEQLLHALKCGAPPHGGIALGKAVFVVGSFQNKKRRAHSQNNSSVFLILLSTLRHARRSFLSLNPRNLIMALTSFFPLRSVQTRIRSLDGDFVQGAVDTRCDCIPKDECGERSSVQKSSHHQRRSVVPVWTPIKNGVKK